MSGVLRLAISTRINDKDDFRRLVISSDDGTSEVFLFRDPDAEMVCERDGERESIQEDNVFKVIDDLISQGFTSLTCECWSGNVHIRVPSDERGNVKITYSQPDVTVGMDQAKHLIDVEEASDLLHAIEITNIDGHMTANMRRKYVQIDSFVRLIWPLLNKSSKSRKIHILDCGSGKSYLSFVMNYFLREKMRRSCHFFCVDTNIDIIERSTQIRNELGYDNMEFFVSRIRDFQPREQVDIVCSLHACDTASDEAIARGVQLNAPFLLIVPCCQHEVIDQLRDHPLKAITRHGTYKAKLADLLTDALRTLVLEAAGYKVSVTEYVSPAYTPKNIMIQAEKVQSRNKMAMKQYQELKALFGNLSLELERLLPGLFS